MPLNIVIDNKAVELQLLYYKPYNLFQKKSMGKNPGLCQLPVFERGSLFFPEGGKAKLPVLLRTGTPGQSKNWKRTAKKKKRIQTVLDGCKIQIQLLQTWSYRHQRIQYAVSTPDPKIYTSFYVVVRPQTVAIDLMFPQAHANL